MDFKDLVDKYDYFIFDVDGVLIKGGTEIEDSFKGLDYILTQPQKKIFFLTNNSTK